MNITTLAVLKFVHIVSMVYWLGGEWGIFNVSRNVIDRNLSMEERKRHMRTAYVIDIPARSGIIMLFPLGFHMGYLWGLHPYGGWWLIAMWIFLVLWLSLCWAAFFLRETDLGTKLTKIDEIIRWPLIPTLLITMLTSLMGMGPFEAGEGQKWFSLKVGIFGGLLIIGLFLRWIMREWTTLFKVLAESPNPEAESQLELSLRFGRFLAYFYWIGILFVAFLGAVKPF